MRGGGGLVSVQAGRERAEQQGVRGARDQAALAAREHRPIRGQYPGHVIRNSQSEALRPPGARDEYSSKNSEEKLLF